MKILAVADLHGEEKAYVRMKKMVAKYEPELIISAGDHTWFGKDERKFLKLMDFGIPVLLLPGNHEVPEATKRLIKTMKHIVWIHRGVYKKGEVIFLGCGEGGFCCGNSDFENVKHHFSDTIKKHKGKTVLITHEPPYDTGADEVMPGSHVGSKSLRDFIKEHQPNLHVCGHIHEASGAVSRLGKTMVINAGSKGKVIEV
jgi:uncharacterized protein